MHEDTNPAYHQLISEFNKKTGCSVIVNTSFNVRGEPIVMSPEDAYLCFIRTEMDYLVMGHLLLDKRTNPRSAAMWTGERSLNSINAGALSSV